MLSRLFLAFCSIRFSVSGSLSRSLIHFVKKGKHFSIAGEVAYLPGKGDTMITKVVFPGRGSPIALWGVLTPAISPNAGNSTA